MKILSSKDYLTETMNYNIFIKPEDNLEPFEIAECFTKQFPKERAIISFSKKEVEIRVGLIIVGLNLKKEIGK